MLKAKIEAILFLTDKPMKAAVIARTLNEDVQVVRQGLLELIHDYEERQGGLEVADDNGYIIQVKDDFSSLINEFAPLEMPLALLRTLSAIAIKQPVQQSEVIKIRGAGAYDHVKELVMRELIVKKEADEGRSPLLMTTKKFQEYFRLSGDGKSLRTELHKPKLKDKLVASEGTEDGEAVQLQLDEAIAAGIGFTPPASTTETSAPLAAGEEPIEGVDMKPQTLTSEASASLESLAAFERSQGLEVETPLDEASGAHEQTVASLELEAEELAATGVTSQAGQIEASVLKVQADENESGEDLADAVTTQEALNQLEEIFDASPDTSFVFPTQRGVDLASDSDVDGENLKAPPSISETKST